MKKFEYFILQKYFFYRKLLETKHSSYSTHFLLIIKIPKLCLLNKLLYNYVGTFQLKFQKY